MYLLLVTGMSGAGKSCVVKALEDIGFYCTDNLTSSVIPVFARTMAEWGEHPKVAFVTDIRAGFTYASFSAALDELEKARFDYDILFVDAKDSVLVNRYKETRRRHPLMNGDIDSIEKAVEAERNLLDKAKQDADILLDTSSLSAIECRSRVVSMFSHKDKSAIHVQCISFGFKHGIPADSDMVFDVRFLPNPFYIPELKNKTGLDKEVSDYVMSFPEAAEYEKKIIDMIDYIIPLCCREGRTQLVVSVGCTGGHHRSVTFADRLCKKLIEKNFSAGASHRDIKK